MSRSTSSRSTFTIVPETMSPSLKYLMVSSIAARKASSSPMSFTATWGTDGVMLTRSVVLAVMSWGGSDADRGASWAGLDLVRCPEHSPGDRVSLAVQGNTGQRRPRRPGPARSRHDRRVEKDDERPGIAVAGYQLADADESARGNRAWWDAAAQDYQSEHGEFLGRSRFV